MFWCCSNCYCWSLYDVMTKTRIDPQIHVLPSDRNQDTLKLATSFNLSTVTFCAPVWLHLLICKRQMWKSAQSSAAARPSGHYWCTAMVFTFDHLLDETCPAVHRWRLFHHSRLWSIWSFISIKPLVVTSHQSQESLRGRINCIFSVIDGIIKKKRPNIK